ASANTSGDPGVGPYGDLLLLRCRKMRSRAGGMTSAEVTLPQMELNFGGDSSKSRMRAARATTIGVPRLPASCAPYSVVKMFLPSARREQAPGTTSLKWKLPSASTGAVYSVEALEL